MLLHRVEVDERPAPLIPEQVVPLKVAMADALAPQGGKQAIQRKQLHFRRPIVQIRLPARDYIVSAEQFGN